jgi:glyoxylase-like metal-dependent hydrolase (beta-lactamase superfamily II)
MSLPSHLAETCALGAVNGEPIAQFEIGGYKNFVYLILDWETKKAAIVDPQTDLSAPLNFLKKHHFQLTGILLTHTHFDHIAGVPQLIKSYPDLPLYVHPGDLHRLEGKAFDPKPIRKLQDKDQIMIGKTQIEVIYTPGHSPGECCYFLPGKPPYLLTGDTIFIRDCGRTDLEGGSNEQMFQSIQKIKTLPPATIILPGHHYRPECASTLKKEIVDSLPFQCQSVQELSALP